MTEKPHRPGAPGGPPDGASPDRLRVSQLGRSRALAIDLRPDGAARDRLAAAFGLIALPRLRLYGRLAPAEGDAFRFDGRLEAEVVQPCAVTLEPVTTAIDEPVGRTFSPHAGTPEGGEEAEMGDDELVPLGDAIDLAGLAAEELSLALPPWPRAPGASLPEEDGDEAGRTDESRRPFAGLADLLKKE